MSPRGHASFVVVEYLACPCVLKIKFAQSLTQAVGFGRAQFQIAFLMESTKQADIHKNSPIGLLSNSFTDKSRTAFSLIIYAARQDVLTRTTLNQSRHKQIFCVVLGLQHKMLAKHIACVATSLEAIIFIWIKKADVDAAFV